MIITEQKSFTEIMEAVGDVKSLFLIGCGDCATLCKTGGEDDLKEMTEKLAAEGIEVTGSAVVPATCHELDTKRVMRKHKEETEKAEGFLVLTCGAGIQAVGDNTEKIAISGCDSLFIGNSRRQLQYYEKCSACGNCVLNITGGICPETRCPKGLLNGPCGGAVDGKCEVDGVNNCAWIEIYDRLKTLGRLELLDAMVAYRDSRDSSKPRGMDKSSSDRGTK